MQMYKAREPKCDGVSLDDLIRASAAMLPAEISYLSSGVSFASYNLNPTKSSFPQGAEYINERFIRTR